MTEEEASPEKDEDPTVENSEESVNDIPKKHHGFRPACRPEAPTGIVPPAREVATQDKQVEKSIEAPALGPEQEPKAKPDSCKHGAIGSHSFGTMLAVIALLMLGLCSFQLLQQRRMTEQLLAKQDKIHRGEVRRLNERLVDMSDQNLALQQRATAFQTRTQELQREAEEYETAVSIRDGALRELEGELASAQEEQNATVAKLAQQMSRDTGMLEEDRKNMEESQAVLSAQARALEGQGEQATRDERQIRLLRHDLEASKSQQTSLKEQLNKQSHQQKAYQQSIVDSVASWKQKLQALEDQKEALRRDLDGERETLRLLSTSAKEKLESAQWEANRRAGKATAKLEAQVASQENLVQSLLQQLHQRTEERDAGKRHVAQLQKHMQKQELKALQDAISARLQHLPDSLENVEEEMDSGQTDNSEVLSRLRGQASNGKRRRPRSFAELPD